MRKPAPALLAVLAALAVPWLPAASSPVAAAPAAGPWLLVVSGIAGDEAHRESFLELSLRLLDAAVHRYGVPEDNVRYLAERTELAPERVHGRSTADNVTAAVRWIAASAGADDPVMIVLIGHGSAQGGEARFNLPGPDMGAADFATLLDELDGRPVAFVNTASSSGGFLPLVAGDGRVVITATRGSHEREETLFPAYFVEAYTGGAADTDRDGRVSALEAFVYASAEVRRAYEDDGRLLTEHALLEDDGDGEGAQQPDPDAGDGALARTVVLGGPAGVAPGDLDDPEIARLVEQREQLQGQLDALRSRREEMAEDEYLAALEELLVQIAEVDRQIRERGGGGP